VDKILLFSSGDDNQLNIFDLQHTPQVAVASFSDHVSLPLQVDVSHDEKFFVSCGRDKASNSFLISFSIFLFCFFH
jgi:WD40 repeat protein